MAFIHAASISPLCSQRRDEARLCSKPLRNSQFLPKPSSRPFASCWSHALQTSRPSALVVKMPLLCSVQVGTSAAPRILISGAPASGKGTQCEYIVSKYGVVHISTGDMLRAAVKSGSQLGKQAKTYMDAGQLVPDDVMIAMLKERIGKSDCESKGWLLDGFPRTAVQAKALSDAGIVPDAVVCLDVEEDVLIERVVGRRSDPVTGKIYHLKYNPPQEEEVLNRLEQRSDDTEEKAKVRLQTYNKHKQSVQDHYSHMIKVVNGNRDKSQVFQDIQAIVDESLKQQETDDPDGGQGGSAEGNPGGNSGRDSQGSQGTRGIAVAEFVRRAEEAYERGSLLNEDVNWSGQAAAETEEDAGTSGYADLGRRLDLAAGDVASLLLFAYIGRATHGDKAIDFGVVKTAAPFIAAWIGTAPLLGAYTRRATANVKTAITSFAKAWAVGVPMGIGIRGVVTDHVPPAVFAVISLVSTFLILGSWRVVYVKVRGDETDSERRGGVVEGFRMITTLLRRW